MKRRSKKLDKRTEARRLARKSGLVPAATRVMEDKRRKAPKHKHDLQNENDGISSLESDPDRT
jgi:hypothetical protein